ncbi:MAG TPA: UDP-N-acetylmuramoyl-tripeptide--D-alanyl-D-alanine ligase [Nitrospinae bacterium]|nr:UDP-N-acetylmuramoyl-tripeptide--D-alanyl-D-alanine ligase [Nitrospinota bacterium]
MITGKAEDCLSIVGGKLLQGSAAKIFRGVSINSRTIEKEELFVCIQGKNFDGHNFLGEVINKGAAGVILSNPSHLPEDMIGKGNSPFVIQSQNTLRALQDLASYQRTRFPLQVVAVTGTNGKSTTKEMIASIIETKYKTLKTQGNLNNHIGLTLTLLARKPEHEVGVLEMGMSAAGEIKRLAEIAKPDIGVITNISTGHLEQLKTVKDVQAAKGELFDSLSEEGTAIVNADDPLVLELAKSLRVKKITYGIEQSADVQARNIQNKGRKGFTFTAKIFNQTIFVNLSQIGYCNIYNALAALAAGHSLGISGKNMNLGLDNYQQIPQRNEQIHYEGVTLINDAYNANPQSMREALKTLSEFDTQGKRFLIIGDMLELGPLSESAHHELGQEIILSNVDHLVTVGPLASLAAESAKKSPRHPLRIGKFNTHAEAANYLLRNVEKGDCLLIKGSRGAKMENVIQEYLKT